MIIKDRNSGFALITTLFMMSVLLAVLGAYAVMTTNELSTNQQSGDSAIGFFTSEAGLNLRAENIRLKFVGFNRPSGVSPTEPNPCIIDGNLGSGDYACQDYELGGHPTTTYVIEPPGNPKLLTIPPGERYQYLTAQEYRYTASSVARNPRGTTEANLELHFKSRLVPLFQFAAFYDKDLEILPGPTMTLAGPVHTNGDLYLNTDAGSPGLTIQGQITSAGKIFRGRKNQNLCNSNPVRVYNPTTAASLIPSCATRVQVTQTQINPWNKMIQFGVPSVTVPPPEEFDPLVGSYYWDMADLRLVLNVNGAGNPVTTYATTGIEVRNTNDSVDAAKTTALSTCAGNLSGKAVNTSITFRNNREGKLIRMLDIDTDALLSCIHTKGLLVGGRLLSDDTEGGLVFYLTVKGPNENLPNNNYGVRVRDGSNIKNVVAGAPAVKGLSIISNQAMYIQGNWNSTNKIPAAFMVDSVNILSNAWSNDANSNNALTGGTRQPTATTVNAAFLSGTDTTGNVEGIGGQNGAYNGGLENYPRFHENWSNGPVTFTYTGSFVSLGKPRHVNGAWVYGGTQYTAPTRAWAYDTSFNNGANLPPITPRFVYLRQELFVRQYDQS